MRSLLKWTWRIATFLLTARYSLAASDRRFSQSCLDFGKNQESCHGWQWSRHFKVAGGPDSNDFGVKNNDGFFLFFGGSDITDTDFPRVTSPRLNFSSSRACEVEYLIYQIDGQAARYEFLVKNFHVNKEPTFTDLKSYSGDEVQKRAWVRKRHKIGRKTLPFQVVLQIRGKPGDEIEVAFDSIRLRNCAEEISTQNCNYTCESEPERCLDLSRICDLERDCPLGDDELQNCDQVPEFARCDFEKGIDEKFLCEGWSSYSSKEGESWLRRQPGVNGPAVDHTFKNYSGHFVTVKFVGLRLGKNVELRSPTFPPPFYYHRDNNSSYYNSCTARFHYDTYEKNMGNLIVSVVENRPHPGAPIELLDIKKNTMPGWHRMVVPIPHGIRNQYHLIFTAQQKLSPSVSPAIDDFTLSPECFGINVPDSELRINPQEAPPLVVFGVCGARGGKGPSKEMCRNSHPGGLVIAASVNITFGGTQVYRIPNNGFYTFFAKGAAGGLGIKSHQSQRGKGDFVRAIFYLNADEDLYVVVGQKGSDASSMRMNDGSPLDNFRRGLNRPRNKRHKRDIHDILRERSRMDSAELGGGGGGGATFIFKSLGEPSSENLALLLVAAGGGGLSSVPTNDQSLYVNPDAMGQNLSLVAQVGYSEPAGAGAGGSFGNYLHNYTVNGVSVGFNDHSGLGGHPCQKKNVFGGSGGFGGGGGGCEGGGGGGGFYGGDGGTGKMTNGRGGYSYISNAGIEQLVEKGTNDGDGSVVLAMGINPGDQCGCSRWCVHLSVNAEIRKCVCEAGYILDKDGVTCLEKLPVSATRLSLHHLIVIILCILVSAAVIMFFFCLAFNRFRKTQAGGSDPSQEGLSNAEVQLSRLRAQAAGAGGGMVTEYNPNYEFGGSTCTLQDLKEIPRENLTLVKALGQGAFGEVYQGYLANVPGESTELTVAVKTLPEAASAQAEQDFFTEAMIMSKFNHPNIVRFIGVCFDKLPRFIVLELLQGGDLKSFLREFRPKPNTPPMLTMDDLLKLASDVAKGCQYLEENHFIHRDIAARNCLLTTKSPSGVVKIADFGMARDIYRADYYRKGGKAMLPVKWMPPEAFMDGVFTSKTDIWSFGVLLWEVMSLGYMPYPGRGNQEVMQLVTSGRRLEAPRGCPGPVYHLMTQCWHPVPEERPTFGTILERLGYCTQDPDVISTALPVFDRPPSMEKDATIMRPPTDSAETCLQSPGSEDYLIPMPSSNYSLGTVMSDLQSGSTSVDSMDRLLGGPSTAGRSLTGANSEGADAGPAPALPPRAPNIVFSPTEACVGNVLQSPDGTWETSFSTPSSDVPSCKIRPDGYVKLPAEDGGDSRANSTIPLLLTNVGAKASSTLSLDALPTVPPAPSTTPEKTANLLEGPNDEGASAPLLVSLDANPSVFNTNHNALQTLDAGALNQNTSKRLSYANVDVNSAKNSTLLETTELPFPIGGEGNAHVNC